MPGNNEFWLVKPVDTDFFVTSRFNDPRDYGNGLHEGIDFKAVDSSGRPVNVFAAQRGVIDRVDNYPPGYGKYVRIRHDWPDGTTYVTWYGHMSQIIVSKGEFVSAGDRIGVSGNTGNSTGIHLHLTLQHIGHGLNGYVVDDVVNPFPFFRFGPTAPVKELQFVADETIPDGSLLQPGTSFVKTWRIRNSGTVAWEAGYELAFSSGDQMEGPTAVGLPPATAGQEVSVSIPLVVPTRSGRKQGEWKARDAQGQFFEFPLTVEIVVAGDIKQDNLIYLQDVTVPDGTAMHPGETFLKQWKVRNTGNTAWSAGYQLAYFDDQQMGAPNSVPVPLTRPGEENIVAVTLSAPQTPGTYRSTWRMRNRDGEDFGEVLFVLIKVQREVITPQLLSEMSYVNDITIPDGTAVIPGQVFEKVWRVRNTGQSRWGAGYELAFFNHHPMGASDSIPLPAIGPGQTADISIAFEAPDVPGSYLSTWKGRDPDGNFFEHDLYAEIQVIAQTKPGDKVDDSRFVKDVTILDGTTKRAGESFIKTWRARNTGTTTWGSGYTLAFYKDEQMTAVDSVPIPLTEPGDEVDISVNLTAPLNPGQYKSTWKIRNPQRQIFGDEFYCLIKVPSTQPVVMDNRVRFMGHETVNLWTVMKPGEVFEKIWIVRNIGASDWGDGYSLAFLDGKQMSGPDSVAFPYTESQRTVRLKVTLKTPMDLGTHKGYWTLRDPTGKRFGPRLPVWIIVKSA